MRYAPYGEVFPRARFLVHHGGIGTTGEALRTSCPQLVVPIGSDQYDNAALVAACGVGEVLRRNAVHRASMTTTLKRLLAREAGYRRRAEEISSTLRCTPSGFEIAVQSLFGLAAGAAPGAHASRASSETA